jgi:adenylylsulfate kinase-like enzyme
MLAVDADREGRGVADRFPALLVTGPPGVGKTAVAKEIREQLFHAGLPHAVIDLDELARIRPAVIDGSTFHADLVARNLRAIWPNYLAAGVERVVLVVGTSGEGVPGPAPDGVAAPDLSRWEHQRPQRLLE